MIMEKGTCMLIDFETTGDRNVIKKEVDKILKYKGLIKEIQCMWNVKAKEIPVLIGVMGIISKPLRQYLSSIPEKQDFEDLQRIMTLGTTQLLWKVPM